MIQIHNQAALSVRSRDSRRGDAFP